MIAREQLGIAMSAYFGGRAECRIRLTPVPVVYVDFTSMYPTVNALLGLWQFHTAERVDVVDATSEVQELLETVSLAGLFNPAQWSRLNFFARVHPADDVLPIRAHYGHDRTYNIGLNHSTSNDPLWYAGPDLVASALLTGRPPRIDSAFRLVPVGVAPDLRSVALGGRVPVDPTQVDFFRAVIEERMRLPGRTDLDDVDKKRLKQLLKVVATSGGYGIFAEMNRQTLSPGKTVALTVYSQDARRSIDSTAPEQPGRYCCPPVAALITAAARLMLAMLERCVTDAGGSYAFCDTDSLAIVATRDGGAVPCNGGPIRLPDQRQAIRALSWTQVDTIVSRFAALNPYARDAVPHSILKIEKYNYVGNDETKERREIECYAISAKRYALFVRRADGSPRIVQRSEHGLGALLNPEDQEGKDTADETEECEGSRWITRAWESIVSRALGMPAEWPHWNELPAVSRLTTSKPALLAPFKNRNRRKPYADQVKPFNFVLTAHLAQNGRPQGVDADRFLLVAPYERDAQRWSRMKYTDRHSGKQFSVSTGAGAGIASRERARVLSYADMLEWYERHPEQKSAAPDGAECRRDTRGLLGRRHVVVGAVEWIGKESNLLDEVDAGLIDDWDDVLTSYGIVGSEGLPSVPEPLIGITQTVLAKQTGVPSRTLRRVAKRPPRMRARRALLRAAADNARKCSLVQLPDDDRTALEVFRRLPESQRRPARTCRQCAAPLIRSRGVYCDDACRQAAYRLRHGQHREKKEAKTSP